MPYDVSYTEPEKVVPESFEEMHINQNKKVIVILKNGKSFQSDITDRWDTYTQAQKDGFKFVFKDLIENAKDENGNTPDSVSGDL